MHCELKRSPDLYQTQSETHKNRMCGGLASQANRMKASSVRMKPMNGYAETKAGLTGFGKTCSYQTLITTSGLLLATSLHIRIDFGSCPGSPFKKNNRQQHIGASWWINGGKPNSRPYCLPVDIDARRVASTGQGLPSTI
jgi:hypothetical protein